MDIAEKETLDCTSGFNHIIYNVNKHNIITYVNHTYRRLASQNDLNDNIIGTDIYDYITDVSTKYWYKLILNKVRQYDKIFTINYSCHDPLMHRVFNMNIIPIENNGIKFINTLISESKL